MCFVWIWEQTAIISLYNINWLVFITKIQCLLRGTDFVFIYTQFRKQQHYLLLRNAIIKEIEIQTRCRRKFEVTSSQKVWA